LQQHRAHRRVHQRFAAAASAQKPGAHSIDAGRACPGSKGVSLELCQVTGLKLTVNVDRTFSARCTVSTKTGCAPGEY
jgi:hypothetical protein